MDQQKTDMFLVWMYLKEVSILFLFHFRPPQGRMSMVSCWITVISKLILLYLKLYHFNWMRLSHNMLRMTMTRWPRLQCLVQRWPTSQRLRAKNVTMLLQRATSKTQSPPPSFSLLFSAFLCAPSLSSSPLSLTQIKGTSKTRQNKKIWTLPLY